MNTMKPDEDLKQATESLAGHAGVVGVQPLPGRTAFEIEYDPARLSDDDLRRIAEENVPAPSLQKRTLRLDGAACEACAIRLERRVAKIPGVRKATATYLGKILCLTFDDSVSDESAVLQGVRATGAAVRPYEAPKPDDETTLWQKVRAGELNEEISCGLGFLFLITSLIVHRAVGLDATVTYVLYAGAYIFCGQQGVRSAIASLREKVLDVDVLMVLAAIGAGIVGQPFEGALLLFLFSFSNVLQSYALQRTQKAIHSLLKLRPDKALLKRDGATTLVRVETLQVGDIVVVRPGEHIPVDGKITEGSSAIDESSLTGESMPVSKTVGATLFAGTLNQSGGLELAVTKRAEDSTLARMVKLVEEAQAEKSGTQRFLEQAEQYYATGVIAFTAVVWFVPWLVWHQPFAEAFYRAMTVMVVASPCALVISTPATVLSAIGGAARRGILIKGGSHLEHTAQISIVAFDKTGTLTVGRPTVTEIVDAQGAHKLDGPVPEGLSALLAASAALESKSEHPLATAIIKSAATLKLALPEATDFQSTAGKGAEATVNGMRLVIGSERLFRELGASGMDKIAAHSTSLSEHGKTCVWVGSRAGDAVTALAVLALADTIRHEAKSIAASLHKLGVKKVVMLTGDQRAVAHAIAEEAGVDEVLAELLPEGKVDAIRELKKQGRVMMIGDGVNDAPALAVADIGVAMGAAGTDIAMETADVVLMGDKLENIPLLIGIARHAKRVLWQNLIFASGVIVVLLIAAFGINLALPMGVVGHEGSTVLVCLNGLRLLIYKPKKAA
jgi:Cd2+/Zn2+-exporting ATPase